VSGDDDRTRPRRRSAPARPPLVLEAQRALRDLGYDPGPIDGIFGPRTRAALEKSLTLERLDVDRRLFRPTREP
jgi:peptidoglycan hydrolase-like protein with peptidoglycan-binding domain